MKNSLFCLLVAMPCIAVVQAQDISSAIDGIAKKSASQKNLIQQRYLNKMEDHFTDKLAAELILKQQGIKAIEYMRQIVSLPQVADNSKRFTLPNLQAALNVYTKSTNYPVPEDVQQASKNGAMALQQIIKIEEERQARRADNPFAPEDAKKTRDEEKQLLGLRSQYDSYMQRAEKLRLQKYGIDTQEYNKQIMPVISSCMKEVSATAATPEEKAAVLNALFDAMLKYW